MKKNVLLTGASRGIGKSIYNKFNNSNYNILAPTRSELDLSSNTSIDNFLKNLNEIDILVNNAGIAQSENVENIKLEDFQKMIQINVTACLRLISGVAKQMKNKNSGKIVNMSSIYSNFSFEKRVMYSTVKSAINGMTKSMAVEFAKYNVLVNAVAPGFTNTDMMDCSNSSETQEMFIDQVPMKRMAEPDEIAELVYFLCSDKNTYITGQTIFIDGGFSCY